MGEFANVMESQAVYQLSSLKMSDSIFLSFQTMINRHVIRAIKHHNTVNTEKVQ